MKQFELLFLDSLNRRLFMQYFIGGDDLAALAEAERLSSAHTVELWEGIRRVARVKKGNVALACTDRLSG